MWLSKDAERELRNPPPQVIAMLARMIMDMPKDIKLQQSQDNKTPAPDMLRLKWNEIVDELLR